MAKPQIAFRVPPDTKEKFDEFAEKRGLNNSDAGRRLVEAGLESELGSGEDNTDRITFQQSAAFTSLRVSVYLLAISALSTLLSETFLTGVLSAAATLSLLLFAVAIGVTILRLFRTFELFREDGYTAAAVLKVGATGAYRELSDSRKNDAADAE